ncbi:hypothetical protein ACEPPN_000915 [Leptodophora sp. 'Broadleaf-Isolate-01']
MALWDIRPTSQSPSGSSTWSAVAVSAGYCPIAIGTDTFGSLITTPSTRAALYSLRSTVDLISRRGIIPISELFDTTRPMAKSVVDLANLMDVLVTPGHKTHSFLDALPGTFKDINIGVLRPEDWFFDSSIQRRIPSASAQIIASIYDAYAKINAHAKSLQEVSLISADELVVNVYNNQDQLVRAENNDLPEEQQAKLLRHARWISRDLGIDKTLKDYGVDVIIVPADSSFNLLVSAAAKVTPNKRKKAKNSSSIRALSLLFTLVNANEPLDKRRRSARAPKDNNGDNKVKENEDSV